MSTSAQGETMFGRVLKVIIQAGLFGAINMLAQTTCGNTKLGCLLPTALHTNLPTFNFFNEAFATQIGQLPLATPASGFILTFDKQKGVYTNAQESFGPLLAERVETIGRHKVYLAFTYQWFDFTDIDGNDLNHLPILFSFPSAVGAQVVTETDNHIDTKVNQFVVFGTFGLSENVDVSIAIPLERISMEVTTKGTEFSTTTSATTSFTQYLPGVASGFGDVVISGKGMLLKWEEYGLAVGGELHLPTGDEQNFLGSGAVGIKPYFVLARSGKVSPHLNLAYQWNGNSALAIGQDGKEQSLPGFFAYTIGADMGLSKRFTLAADWLGQHFFGAPQISTPRNVTAMVNGQPTVFSSVVPISGGYNVNNLSLGVKANPWRRLLLMGNVTIKLDGGGLRSTVVPLAGVSYSF
jgi:hypothetical protein